MASTGKYEVGCVVGQFEILERPNPKDRDNSKFKVKCLGCQKVYYQWATSVYYAGRNNRPFGCRGCYDRSMRREDSRPAFLRHLISYKSNAKSRGLRFDLTNDEFKAIASENCFYCGASPEYRTPPKEWQSGGHWSGVDRIDNSLGYSIDNCVPCCRQCNWAKRDMTQEEFYLWTAKVISSGWYGVLG